MAEQSFPKRRSRRGRAALLALAGLVSLSISAGSAFAIYGIRHFERVVPELPVGPTCRGPECLRDIEPGPCVRDACNFLLLGSDTREGLSEEDQASLGNPERSPGQRADTIILVQTDVRNDRTIVLSIPRDLRVEIPGHGVGRINSAFEHGPNTMIRTVERLTGLEVNHYVQVNFEGFRDMVDALGGVPICIDRPMTDRLAGLRLERAGCHNLQGDQALAFVRARHVEGDLIPDFSRIARQQQFIRAVIQKALSVGAVFNYPEIVAAAGDNLKRDRNLNLYELQDLSVRLADLGQESVDFRVVPARPVQIDGASYVEMVEPSASRLLDRIRRGVPLGSIGKAEPGTPISPANIEVRVWDADSQGRADDVAGYLRRAGFVVTMVEAAPPEFDRSLLLWGHGAGNQQRVVSSYLPTLSDVYDNRNTRGSEITVVIAAGFQGLDDL